MRILISAARCDIAINRRITEYCVGWILPTADGKGFIFALIFFPFHLDVLHLGIRGALVAPGDHLLNLIFFALKTSLHAPVVGIAHPARKTQFVGLLLGIGAEEHPLHPAGYKYMRPFIGHKSGIPANQPLPDILKRLLNQVISDIRHGSR